MLNLDAIKPQEGVLPPRPASLRRPTDLQATQTDEAVVEILNAGKAVVCGGLSLIGEEGYMVSVISLLQVKDENLHGWFLALGHPYKEEPDFEKRNDKYKMIVEELAQNFRYILEGILFLIENICENFTNF